jgi:hypothetical protein
VLYQLPRVLIELGSGAVWIVILLVIFYAAVMAVFVRHIGEVLRALLEEHDPKRRRVLHEVLRDLLEPFRRGKRR